MCASQIFLPACQRPSPLVRYPRRYPLCPVHTRQVHCSFREKCKSRGRDVAGASVLSTQHSLTSTSDSLSRVQFSLVPFPDWVIGGTQKTIRQRSSSLTTVKFVYTCVSSDANECFAYLLPIVSGNTVYVSVAQIGPDLHCIDSNVRNTMHGRNDCCSYCKIVGWPNLYEWVVC